ncbi:hypothetical protein ZWY2020_049219 [Hordeum vulgare]|nr:hypothetical protein ZWY2020_049219 [Hordeum vulgare]
MSRVPLGAGPTPASASLGVAPSPARSGTTCVGRARCGRTAGTICSRGRGRRGGATISQAELPRTTITTTTPTLLRDVDIGDWHAPSPLRFPAASPSRPPRGVLTRGVALAATAGAAAEIVREIAVVSAANLAAAAEPLRADCLRLT